jgi:hypothetical protein
MSLIRWIGWTTWSTVSSGFREIELRGDRLGLWGVLPHLLPQRTWLASISRLGEDCRSSRNAKVVTQRHNLTVSGLRIA